LGSALDSESLRHAVWVAAHGQGVPAYFRLVFALPPAVRNADNPAAADVPVAGGMAH
jgi:hypothetical protein